MCAALKWATIGLVGACSHQAIALTKDDYIGSNFDDILIETKFD